MAYEDPNRLTEWLAAVREHVPTLRRSFGEWWAQIRDEPALLWETPPVRYGAYGVGGLLFVWMMTFAIEMITPPPPAGARPEATTADFHVVCTNATCKHHFVIHREFGFDDFPQRCPKCKKESGQAALRCSSKTCNGRWVAPVVKNGVKTCPICGNAFP